MERLITLRGELRDGGSYQAADAIGDALAAVGLHAGQFFKKVLNF